MPADILVVEDEAIVALGIEEQLNKLGHRVVGVAERAEQAVDLAGRNQPDLVLMDIRLKGPRDGVDAAREIRALYDIPIVFLTAYGDESTLRRAEAGDAFGYLIKPCRESDLRATVATALHRHEAERRLRDSEERYRTTINVIELGILASDEQGLIQFLNPEAERLIGRSSSAALRQPLKTLVALHDETAGTPLPSPADHCRAEDRPVRIDAALLVRDDGSRLPVEVQAVPISRPAGEQSAGIVLTLRDLTQSRRTAEQLQYLQKMESVGVIAAGVAHDFNNLLTPILGFIDLALGDIPAESPARSPLVESQKAARRAADLTMHLLAYSGKGRLVPEATNLSKLVEEMLVLLQASVSKKATLRFQLSQKLPEIRADATQLRPVLLNLVINASEALEDQPGDIRVVTGEEVLDNPHDLPGAPPGISAGKFVFLEVSDSGVGMDADTLAKVFDPFFTTKFLGRGLGLAAAQGIVRGHRGVIQVRSAPGQGTTFHVSLPVKPVLPEPADPAPPPQSTPSGVRGTILLAEDESAVRMVVQRILEKDGWTVIAARDGEEAVEAFQKLAEPPMLVVLDLTMPRLSGREALARIHQLNPRAPVLVMSGYSAEEVATGFAAGDVRGFLQKPFAPAELLAAVNAALAQGERGA